MPMKTSSCRTIPRSPWLASAGWTKYAGVPVLDMVEAILRAMCPDLPIPLTITRPLQARISDTAARNRSSRRAIMARTASASIARTRRASSSAVPVASFGIMAGEYSPTHSVSRSMDAAGASLQPILILLAAAVLAVAACRLLSVPPIIGYLAVGLALGPRALGAVHDDAQTRHLAEFGVVFLMFSIGLEFSLSKLRVMRREVFGLGSAQVAITMAACVALALIIAGSGSWQAGLPRGGGGGGGPPPRGPRA